MESIELELVDYVNKCEFPSHLIPKIAELGINGLYMKDFGGPGLNSIENGAIIFEMSRID
jgi:glutaryl-CoA dehydrogenase